MAYTFDTLSISQVSGVITATISNPPCNVMTGDLYLDLFRFTEEVESDDSVKVVLFKSADPDFFIAHFDVEAILTMPVNEPAQRSEELNPFHVMCERVRLMPKATIACIGGRVGGGGSEFSASCDMRFGVYDKTRINQMEVALGILPGGTGTQRLPRLLGRGRAMEVILGSDDLDGRTAEAWGYLNKAFNSAAEMDAYVDQLANRIDAWPASAIGLAKQSVNAAEKPLEQGLLDEAFYFQQTLRTEEAQEYMKEALAKGAQTREGELKINDVMLEAAKSIANKK